MGNSRVNGHRTELALLVGNGDDTGASGDFSLADPKGQIVVNRW
jgi:hypothetical protein